MRFVRNGPGARSIAVGPNGGDSEPQEVTMFRKHRGVIPIAAVATVLMLACYIAARGAGDSLESGFKNPPNSAKPRVWWHWVDENVSREGITRDLEWMKRTGIGGLQMFDTGLNLGTFVDKPIKFMSSEWLELLRFAASEADRLGLEMAMQSDSGSSTTGGTWVKPEEAMKKYVWSETRMVGPLQYSARLPQPPSVNGSFLNVPGSGSDGFFEPQPDAEPDPTYYADCAVVAYRLPDQEARIAELAPKVTSSAGIVGPTALIDGDPMTAVIISAPRDGSAWIQFEFPQPFTARAFTIATKGGGALGGEIKTSNDGVNYQILTSLSGGGGRRGGGSSTTTSTFPEVSARFYRIDFNAAAGGFRGFGGPGGGGAAPESANQYNIAELEFLSGGRINRWEDKAGFGSFYNYETVPTPAVPPTAVISHSDVIDLTSKMAPDGTLSWNAPDGKWVILRLGYSLMGTKNHPAMPTAEGFEVDKLSRKYVESYFHGYLDPVAKALGPLYGKSFKYLLIDSWEAGMLNWTDEMLSEFRKRRGYDPKPYLPALTGRVVDSAEVSDRFLWDFRRTIADMIADNHYGTFAELLHKQGLGLYSEAAGLGTPTLEDGLLFKGRVDVPMAEFWTQIPAGKLRDQDEADVREAASASHIYGKKLVAAESFTTVGIPAWGQPPSYLKWLADYTMSLGLNQFVIHTSAHQPLERKPGITLDVAGQHFNRHMTWAEQAGSFVSYLARSSYMLQQGLYVADLCYFYGESAPITVPATANIKPEPPAGYSYDFINTEALLNRVSVSAGKLVLPDGMSYRVLVLPETDRMTPNVAKKIRELVKAGATVVGPKPAKSPSLVDYPSSDRDVSSVARDVWGDIDGNSKTEYVYGKGKVVWGDSLKDVLAAKNIPPDFEYSRPRQDTTLVWIHRRIDDIDVYFISNQKERTETITVSLRQSGKAAELWHPDTGEIEPAEYTIADGRTEVTIELEPFGSTFVVFRKKTSDLSRKLPHPTDIIAGTIEGAWDVSFPPNWGAPDQIHLDKLISWTDHSSEGVRHFSGTATYTKEIEAPQSWFGNGTRLVLDLGNVKEIAEVSINNTPLGTLWKPPFQVDITGILKPGANRLEIKITNLWPNRIIGDLALPQNERYTFTTALLSSHTTPADYTKDTPLFESGLIGPVTIKSRTMNQ